MPKKAAATRARFTIDCTIPVDDNVIDLGKFVKFLGDRIKINGKAGVLGDSVKLASDSKMIHCDAKLPFSKRYLKYLSKKYLKKQQLRDFLRVVSTNKSTYTLRYFQINAQDDAEYEEEEE
jgi:large subunit ribosomal protein L22e